MNFLEVIQTIGVHSFVLTCYTVDGGGIRVKCHPRTTMEDIKKINIPEYIKVIFFKKV